MRFKPEERFLGRNCTACGICSSLCPVDAIVTDSSGRVVSFSSACIGCGHCGCYCPADCYGLPAEKHAAIPLGSHIQNLYEGRRSTRRFSEKQIDETVMSTLLEAVGFAPTGQNAQGITVDVILGEAAINKLIVRPFVKFVRILDCCRILSLFAGANRGAVKKIRRGDDIITWKAPCILLFRAPVGNVTGKTDSIIAATMVSIKADTMGLGTLWNGVVQIASPILRVKRCHAALCVGYPLLKKYQCVPAREWTRRDITPS